MAVWARLLVAVGLSWEGGRYLKEDWYIHKHTKRKCDLMKNWDMWWENWNFMLRFRKKEFQSLKRLRSGVIVHKLSSLTNFLNKNLIACCAGSLLMIRAQYRRLNKINGHIVSPVYPSWNLKVDLIIWEDILLQCTVVSVQRDRLLTSGPTSRSCVF